MADDHLTVILIRHAEAVAPKLGGPVESKRPLTNRGHRDAAALAECLAGIGASAVFSSPYLRAIQTVTPVAGRLGRPIQVIEDLRERMLSPRADLPDRTVHLERAWRDFDYAPPGGETSRVAQARVLAVLERLKSAHPSGVLVLGSHGNLISLALNAFDASVNFEFWSVMPMPAVYQVAYGVRGWRVRSGPGF